MGPQIVPSIPRSRVDDGQKYLRVHHLPMERPLVLPDAVHVGQMFDFRHDVLRQGEGEEGSDSCHLFGVNVWDGRLAIVDLGGSSCCIRRGVGG